MRSEVDRLWREFYAVSEILGSLSSPLGPAKIQRVAAPSIFLRDNEIYFEE